MQYTCPRYVQARGRERTPLHHAGGARPGPPTRPCPAETQCRPHSRPARVLLGQTGPIRSGLGLEGPGRAGMGRSGPGRAGPDGRAGPGSQARRPFDPDPSTASRPADHTHTHVGAPGGISFWDLRFGGGMDRGAGGRSRPCRSVLRLDVLFCGGVFPSHSQHGYSQHGPRVGMDTNTAGNEAAARTAQRPGRTAQRPPPCW